MSNVSLAVKYRPSDFSSVVEQGNIKIILQQQINNGTFQHAYLFCGPSGDGKTTLARIFANEINKGKGNPIELDAASHSSVNDVRELSQQAKSKSLDSEYKIFIVDEAHSISNTGWQAFLKLIEEPPAKTIFIFCTTDPQKIPKTILGRVQRFDFQRISTDGIFNRLAVVVEKENIAGADIKYETEALEYISKLADGGMRDALTTLDKVVAYSTDITMENVVKALGVVDYSVMFDLLDSLVYYKTVDCISIVEGAYRKGLDLKQFIKMFTKFVLDVNKYTILKSFKHLEIPETEDYKKLVNEYVNDYESTRVRDIMELVVKLNSQLKWETSPKAMIESTFILECNEG